MTPQEVFNRNLKLILRYFKNSPKNIDKLDLEFWNMELRNLLHSIDRDWDNPNA